MVDDFATINKQYSQAELSERILNSIEHAGYDLDSLSLDDLALFDQLHEGGRSATRALAVLCDKALAMDYCAAGFLLLLLLLLVELLLLVAEPCFSAASSLSMSSSSLSSSESKE